MADKQNEKKSTDAISVILTVSMSGVRKSYSPGELYPCADADEAERLINAGFALAA